MKKNKTIRKEILLLTVLILAFSACNTGKQSGNSNNTVNQEESGITAELRSEHNSRNSIDWAGVYKGMLPCADCEGIVIEIRINADNSYEKVMTYLGKGDNIFRESGSFEWDEFGGRIKIADESTNSGEWYRVGENRLIALDIEGNSIESSIHADMYNLHKIDSDYVITEKYWKLIELNGVAIPPITEDQGREAHFILQTDENRVIGNTGCNNMMGTYELSEEHSNQGKISFSPLATTRMACFDVDYEYEYLNVFENSNRYSIENDRLTLYSEEDSQVALFEAIYLR